MVIDAIDKKLKDKDNEYQDIFEGPTFPQETEMAQFKMLGEVIQENFICLDPLDSSVGLFAREKKERKLNQVIPMIHDRFENDMFARPEHYNDDLPLQMYETLEDEVFKKLRYS